MVAHAIERPKPLEVRHLQVLDDLVDLIMGALEKNPASRPQSAKEMLDELNAIS